MSNGTLRPDGNGGFTGKIETMEISLDVKLVAVKVNTPNSPSYEVQTKSKSGAWIKVGAAWEKRTNEGGEIFYSLTLDDPSFAEPLNVSAFAGKEYGTFEVQWRRPRQAQAA